MKAFILAAALTCAAVQVAGAQAALETRTIELRHLKPAEAVKLLSPYVRSGQGGVFDVSEGISIVTVRDVPENIAVMEQVLAKYDHNPATIRFVFQLIEADTGPRALLASNMKVDVDLDSTLRSVLRFPVYRLLSQSVATAGEFKELQQQLATTDSAWSYEIVASVGAIQSPETAVSGKLSRSEAAGAVGLKIWLRRSPPGYRAGNSSSETVISTGLNVPIGHTVVLGTAATRGSGAALILTVKPELVADRP